jgi:RNA-directed DNA polymerase
VPDKILARLARFDRYDGCFPSGGSTGDIGASAEQRPLGVPAVRDRVVQGALRNVIEPIFERDFAEDSYGFRPGRGCFEALGKVEGLLQAGKYWVVDADIKGYFDSIPQDRLMERIATRISDGRVLKLIESYLKAGILEELKGWQASETGTPQGAVISPLPANIYLDRWISGWSSTVTRWSATRTTSSS